MNFMLTRAVTASSLAIQARLLDRWSHGISLPGGSQVVDATFKLGGVRRRDISEAMANASARVVVTAPLDREREAQDWLHEQIGKAYDWRAVWGFATFSRDWADDQAWFCFELLAGQIESGSSYRFKDRSRVTGRDLIRAAKVLRGES